jgi:hypothetical protein
MLMFYNMKFKKVDIFICYIDSIKLSYEGYQFCNGKGFWGLVRKNKYNKIVDKYYLKKSYNFNWIQMYVSKHSN